MAQLVLGLIIGVATVATIKHSSIFGAQCFHVGEFLPSTNCLHPGIYYGLLGLAALLVILGVVELVRPTPPKA